MSAKVKGIMFMCLSSLAFAFMAIFVKGLTKDVTLFQKLFVRNFVSVIILGIFLKSRGKRLLPSSKTSLLLLTIRSIVGFTSAVLMFYTVENLPIADSSILTRLAPFFVAILAPLLLKEKLNKAQFLPLIIAFFGALLVIKPSFDVDIQPALIGVLSSFIAALAYTALRFLRKYEEPNNIVFCFSFYSMLFALPLMLKFGYYAPTSSEWVQLMIMSFMAILGQIFMSHAYKLAPANEVSIYQYTTIVFTVVLGIIFLSDIPDLTSALGGCFIIGAGYLNYLIQNKKLSKKV